MRSMGLFKLTIPDLKSPKGLSIKRTGPLSTGQKLAAAQKNSLHNIEKKKIENSHQLKKMVPSWKDKEAYFMKDEVYRGLRLEYQEISKSDTEKGMSKIVTEINRRKKELLESLPFGPILGDIS